MMNYETRYHYNFMIKHLSVSYYISKWNSNESLNILNEVLCPPRHKTGKQGKQGAKAEEKDMPFYFNMTTCWKCRGQAVTMV